MWPEKARSLGSPEVLVIRVDVSKVEVCKSFVDEAVEHFGRYSTDITNFVPVMDINFWGSICSTHSAVSHLRKTKGKIIVIASSGGWLSAPRMSIYCASKAAVISLYESVRVEFGTNIGITIVTPGLIELEMTQGKFLSKEGQMKLDQDIRDSCTHLLLITKPGTSEREALSKKILDLTGAKKFLYPPSIQSPELKVD
ncbi:hypothetical protein PVL29_021882 [Vitis rotundifolia]|uniref:Uncharacterized protein n=1 Tax=Vitis rotundifolia TaxID=103349 RepID=A0AA38YU58_VITRO|nr:hypothetical protein PVL29_021882 [Vitis rotundifolia]